MRKKATITVETERLLVISGSHAPATRLWCDECRAEVTMFGLDDASALAGLSDRAIFQLAEAGSIHWIETAEGKALFCVPCLREQTEQQHASLLDTDRKD